ncbi:MAG: HepT-like ribonuclease domain-containing protein [Bacteroidota bacterium]
MIYFITIPDVKDELVFETNLTILRAVEREIGIIGEALSKLQQLGCRLSFSDSIINRRNTIIHQYDAIKPITIWVFIHQDLPELKIEVEGLLT